jgi:hypothetical protein
MNPKPTGPKSNDFQVDAEIGNQLIEVKAGLAGLRNLRASLVQLAYAVAAKPGFEGILLLPDVTVTRDRLEREWQLAVSVFRPAVLDRLRLCIGADAPFEGIPSDPDQATQLVLANVLSQQRAHGFAGRVRGDAHFVVLKVLLNQWLLSSSAVTTEWLMRTSGYTYPTIANVLDKLGSLIERESDRRVRLKWFPREEFTRLLSLSDSARATARFADRSGQPRSMELHVKRLERLAPKGIAIGGVLGAKHYAPDLDLVGLPRLDLSQHSNTRRLDLSFIRDLDPALERIDDPFMPATVVVHAVRSADSFFAHREQGLSWADPVECLLDLHEARLDSQAAQLLDELQQRRPERS